MVEFKQINLKDAINKKIIAISNEYDYIALKYEDGSFSFFQQYEDWGIPIQRDTKIIFNNLIIEYQKYGNYSNKLNAIFELGLITEDEFLSLPEIIEYNKKQQEKIQEKELNELKRLKAKYES